MKQPLPDEFAWVKVGGEAAQELPDIFRRKNLERMSGGGKHRNTFWWGIGESRVDAVRHLKDNRKAVFSEVQKTGSKDKCRRGVRLWRRYRCGRELHDIPDHVIVTSKKPERESIPQHYALVCRNNGLIERSGHDFEDIKEQIGFQYIKKNEQLRNILKNGNIGNCWGHTTRVVRRISGAGSPKLHQVIAVVDLVGPYCVKLENSRELTDKEFNILQSVSQPGRSMRDWQDAVAKIRSAG